MKTWTTWNLILAVGAGIGILAAFSIHLNGWTTQEIVGLAIAIPGFCLWALARLQLGESFAIRPEARALVKHGLYSRMQHPMYVFGPILLAGMIVFLGRPMFFLIFLVLIPLQLNRIRRERAALEAKFGVEYRKYRNSTWF